MPARLSLAKLLKKNHPANVIAMSAIYKLSKPEEVQRSNETLDAKRQRSKKLAELREIEDD